jgi:hypothetical protein
MTLSFDKIASVVINANLPDPVIISDHIDCEEGAILAVKILEDKTVYNQLELVSGRLSTLHKGDVIAVALGNRRALKGFVGEVPKSLKVGDTIHVLNLGGVAGLCTSENVKEVGHALRAEVLGAVTDGTKNLNIHQFTLFNPLPTLEHSAPLIIVSGTCMNVGKTSVAGEIIKHATRAGLTIFATKLAGIAALRDTENMKDYGAKKVVSFVDAGCTSTVGSKINVVDIARGAIHHLSKDNPDFIVIEFGDGIFGEYGVLDILKAPDIQKNIAAHIGCAHDPVGAVQLAKTCEEIGAPLDLISGPVTDNEVGSRFVQDTLSISAYNALTQNKLLFDDLNASCLKK